MVGDRALDSRQRTGPILASLLLLGGFVAGLDPQARAADQPPASAGLSIEGRVVHREVVTLAELQGLPAVRLTIDDPGHASAHKVYTGALLWTLVSKAGPVDAPGQKTRLQHVLLARGRDGYAVALSLAEIDPSFEGKQVIVAYSQDGTALHDLRLVVPNDRKAGRAVKDLAAIDVR
jgi:hypothetical protein